MTQKLTLSINEKTIERAKRFSRKRGKSISRMVEEFLNTISEKENKTENIMVHIDTIMEPFQKRIKLPDPVNYKEMIRQWRYEDHAKESAKKKRVSRKKNKQ